MKGERKRKREREEQRASQVQAFINLEWRVAVWVENGRPHRPTNMREKEEMMRLLLFTSRERQQHTVRLCHIAVSMSNKKKERKKKKRTLFLSCA